VNNNIDADAYRHVESCICAGMGMKWFSFDFVLGPHFRRLMHSAHSAHRLPAPALSETRVNFSPSKTPKTPLLAPSRRVYEGVFASSSCHRAAPDPPLSFFVPSASHHAAPKDIQSRSPTRPPESLLFLRRGRRAMPYLFPCSGRLAVHFSRLATYLPTYGPQSLGPEGL
jgi:hypothetical protein